MNRLRSLSPELARKLKHASVATQRQASFVACDIAIAHAKLDHPLVKSTLDRLRQFIAPTAKEKAELDALVERLDSEYFTLLEAADNGKAAPDGYLPVFGQARALAALSFACGRNALEAATEAIYEAAAAVDDKEKLIAVVLTVLK